VADLDRRGSGGDDPMASENARLAVHPDAERLAREHILNDGTRIMIRPIRPEDAVLEREFVNGLSERSRYLRFMYTLKEITPQMLSRFTQIDYDREMALIAIVGTGENEKEIGVARYVEYKDRRGCEFAIVVSDVWQGKGIATELLERLIDVARNRRLEFMEGMVLKENPDMIELARSLGFEDRAVPEDPGLVLVTMRLQDTIPNPGRS
jgi:acetyltransferase